MSYADTGLTEYRRTGDLTRRKLAEYIPAMVLTNLSTLLLISVDGIVAGNLVGEEALSSISIFYPVTVLTGTVSIMAGVGISTALSTAMGRGDPERLDRLKGTSLRLMIILAAVTAFIQIPVVWAVIRSYGLSEEMYSLVWQYAAGMMIATPLGLISTVGTYELQIAGKMKILMRLSVMEGLSNLAFDLLFTGALQMGVAGAGLGTACANLLRCSVTMVYIARCTDIYRSSSKAISLSDTREILGYGMPDASYSLIMAFQYYLIMRILLTAFGDSAGTIKGVCTFCFSLACVLLNSISGGMMPLMGLLTGSGDKRGLAILMRQGALLTTAAGVLTTLVTCLCPQWFYSLYGVHDVPDGGLMSLRLYSLAFAFKGLNFVLMMYLNNRKDSKYTSLLTVLGNATLPLFAFIISRSCRAPFIFIAYLITEVLVFALYFVRYMHWLNIDRKEIEDSNDIVLYMSVKPDEAVEASRELRSFADEHGIEKRISYRTALCMEEMVAYARAAEASGALNRHNDSGRLNIDIMVRFRGKDSAIFVMLDDGGCIALDRDEEKQKLITDNYGLIKKVANGVEYQYILGMNYTRITF